MKNKLLFMLGFFLLVAFVNASAPVKPQPVKVLVITGGHDYNKETFNQMLTALGSQFSSKVMDLPGAFDMFLPENRKKYDVLVFYHMWQDITDDQMQAMSDCIREGKPLVVLHHSICAFDNWDEYTQIVGGKYFHKPTTIKGTEYQASTYEHDRKITIQVVDPGHPVTQGLKDFDLIDETYYGFYVEPGVNPLLRTNDPTSTPVIAWEKKYGKSRVVAIQTGHDSQAFQNENYRKLLRQAVLWVYGKGG